MANGRGATLDLWQRQAVLAATAFLRERFGPSGDTSAKAVHDALLEVADPTRRAVRLQREMSKSLSDGSAARGERQTVRERRAGGERRQENRGAPMGVERRRRSRRGRDARAPLA